MAVVDLGGKKAGSVGCAARILGINAIRHLPIFP
jgi:hypothetical protein